LSLGISASQTFARPLHRESKLMQQPGHVVIVVADTEVAPDPLANHRPSPNSTGKPDGLRTCLDDADQLVALILRQSRRGAWRHARSEPVATRNVVPLQPPIDRATCHPKLVTQ